MSRLLSLGAAILKAGPEGAVLPQSREGESQQIHVQPRPLGGTLGGAGPGSVIDGVGNPTLLRLLPPQRPVIPREDGETLARKEAWAGLQEREHLQGQRGAKCRAEAGVEGGSIGGQNWFQGARIRFLIGYFCLISSELLQNTLNIRRL